MNNFEFQQRPVVRICNRDYDVDIYDVNFISSLAVCFKRINAAYQELMDLKVQLTQDMNDNEIKEADVFSISEKVAEKNKELIIISREFIISAFGEESYEEMFKGRKPNSAEHMQLCAFIYSEILSQRDAFVQSETGIRFQQHNADTASRQPDHRKKKNKHKH